MAKSPAFQLYVNDFLGSAKVGMMSTEEIGAYMLLLCLDWQEGGFVYEPKRLAKWCRLSPAAFRRAWEVLRECFLECDGRMWNPRLAKEREKQEEWRKKAAKGAATTNKKRWEDGRSSDRPSDEIATDKRGENCRTPSPSPSPSSETEVVVGSRAVEGVTPTNVAVWCNTAIGERWGEQIAPLTRGQSSGIAERFQDAPWELVRDAIAETCRASKKPAPPSHPNYFGDAIQAYLERDAARRDADANPLPRVIRPLPLSPRPTKTEIGRANLAAWLATDETPNGQ